MNKLQFVKRAAALIATEIKEVIQIGMTSGLDNLGDENMEKYPLTIATNEYVENGIFLSALLDVSTLALGNIVNTKLHAYVESRSKVTASLFLNRSAAKVTTALALSRVGMKSYDAYKVRRNSPEFKARRNQRTLFGARITEINL